MEAAGGQEDDDAKHGCGYSCAMSNGKVWVTGPDAGVSAEKSRERAILRIFSEISFAGAGSSIFAFSISPSAAMVMVTITTRQRDPVRPNFSRKPAKPPAMTLLMTFFL